MNVNFYFIHSIFLETAGIWNTFSGTKEGVHLCSNPGWSFLLQADSQAAWLTQARNEIKSSTRYYTEPQDLYRIIRVIDEKDMRSGASSIPIRSRLQSRRPTLWKRIRSWAITWTLAN